MEAALSHDADRAVRLSGAHVDRTAAVVLEYDVAIPKDPRARQAS